MRRFLSIDLGREPVPDATMTLKFRHQLNNKQLDKTLSAQANTALQSNVYNVNTDTTADPTIIGSLS